MPDPTLRPSLSPASTDPNAAREIEVKTTATETIESAIATVETVTAKAAVEVVNASEANDTAVSTDIDAVTAREVEVKTPAAETVTSTFATVETATVDATRITAIAAESLRSVDVITPAPGENPVVLPASRERSSKSKLAAKEFCVRSPDRGWGDACQKHTEVYKNCLRSEPVPNANLCPYRRTKNNIRCDSLVLTSRDGPCYCQKHCRKGSDGGYVYHNDYISILLEKDFEGKLRMVKLLCVTFVFIERNAVN